jgi:hypothetical protein
MEVTRLPFGDAISGHGCDLVLLAEIKAQSWIFKDLDGSFIIRSNEKFDGCS